MTDLRIITHHREGKGRLHELKHATKIRFFFFFPLLKIHNYVGKGFRWKHMAVMPVCVYHFSLLAISRSAWVSGTWCDNISKGVWVWVCCCNKNWILLLFSLWHTRSPSRATCWEVPCSLLAVVNSTDKQQFTSAELDLSTEKCLWRKAMSSVHTRSVAINLGSDLGS